MAAFDVTALPDLGYTETSFHDPMEARWRAEAVTAAKFTPTAITAKIQFMANLEPYNNVDEVFEVLEDYWDTHTKRDEGSAAGRGAVKVRRVRG